jgi:transcriptional regulator with PAS, ATPase and Fis domain
MVEQETFRRDLYFRVNVMRIRVPALRERTEDIPTLARYFLQKYSTSYDKPVRDILPSAMEILVDYDWSGNIRELENVIQGAVILTDGESIAPCDLPEALQELAGPLEVESAAPNSFEDLLRQYKIRLATQAIQQCNGNKTLAARNLQISRAYLHRLVRVAPPEIESSIDVA